MKIVFHAALTLVLALGLACLAAEQPGPARMLTRLPAAVQNTVHAQLGTGRLVAIDRNAEEGEVTYDVEIIRDGKDRSFTVAANGALLDVEVFLSELPAAVQKTLQAHAAKGTLGEIYRSTNDGETTYDAEMTRDGRTRSFTVGADGELLDEQVFLAELPAAVQKAIQAEAGGGTLGEIDRAIEDGKPTYDVEITRGGQTRTFTVGAAGELLEAQVFLSELPAALQKAIQARLGSSKPGDITKSLEDGDVTYDVEVTEGGKTRTLTFDPDGALSSEAEEIHLADAPEAVRKEIQSLLGNGTLAGLSKITEDQEISYDADIKQDGKQKTFSIGADGKLLPSDDAK